MVGNFLDAVVWHIDRHHPVAGRRLDIDGVVADAETHHHLELGTRFVYFVANRSEVGIEHCVGVVRQLGPGFVDLMTRFRRDIGVILARGVRRAHRVAEREYQRTLRAHAVVDFAEIQARALGLLRQMDEFAQSRYRLESRYHHVLVDEFQDTNAVQYAWLRHLAGKTPSLMVVGDDDQSIYGWRGARIENIQQFQTDYPNAEMIRLEQNYRSTSRILRAANTLIANNPHVFEKQLWSELGYGEPLRVIRCRNEEAEAERVAVEIQNQHHQHKRAWRDFAIL